MKFRFLSPRSHKAADLLAAVAEARGDGTAEDVLEFLDPAAPIRGDLARLPDYPRARERIRAAIDHRERIVLFSDYDCDGITSLVQMHDFLRAAGLREVRWFVPDRLRHDYGMTPAAVEECLRQHEPGLLIALDCGSNDFEAIRALQSRGVDTIVVDHHGVVPDVGRPWSRGTDRLPNSDHASPSPSTGRAGSAPSAGSPQGDLFASEGADHPFRTHPALAHLNPRAASSNDPLIKQMKEMSASGLTFLLCRQLAQDFGLSQEWSQDRASLLAGVGTVVDVMPLRGINRSLVKRALRLANDPDGLASVPGLKALQELTQSKRVDARTFGFHWGPRLNASGRLEEASDPVRLLLAAGPEEARPLAERCYKINEERRDLQRGIEDEAVRMAEARLSGHRPDRVLLLHHESWHAGIVGIVAGRLKERFSRPAIVCAWHPDGYWKGSGRSPEGFDLGQAVQDAVKSGVLMAGGGHAMAAGVKVAPDQMDAFRLWLNERCLLSADEMGTVHEVLAPFDAIVSGLPVCEARPVMDAWCALFASLEPFGAGNPRPPLIVRRAEIRWGPKEKARRDTGEIWALSAGFSWSGTGYLFAEWSDVRRAQAEWEVGGRYDLLLAASASEGLDKASGRPTTYYNLRVVDCERVG